ncbi:endonuclease/exonuclease/phosphatase family protein [Winogradskyella marincola]|uniref:Endonuclease/exonuclease/phosphatase family protein n=1 Tax=Winogradskyella marincola TaxID=3037795 RepID=A0ABT6FXH3_9FLAO|nr:endonuclease/exonuclease/phosphatase family protein [Winogradskyella sp. YYF002]MDG4714503.1 endonuclease/exonuclease/phosphatase family protein [Winogradskyella sp. YYF002]
MKNFITLLVVLNSLSVLSQDLKIMSYNIKLDYPKEGKNSWINRKPFMVNQIKFYEPDVLGVQEAMPNQMKDLDSLLTGYSFVGVGRDDGKDEGEYSAIFYKKNDLEVVKSSTFWLSQTPDKVSMGWDAVCNRVCTYALFQHKETKKKFWVFNTHFDHVGKEARTKSAVLILDKIKGLNTENHPVFLTGDFNMEPNHESIDYITQTLKDSKEVTELDFGPEGTFNGFHFDQPVTRRIDYVFVSEDVEVYKYAVLSDSWNMQYPSDHLPVLIEAKLTN